MIDLKFDHVSKKYRIYHEPEEEKSPKALGRLTRRLRGNWTDFWAIRDVSFEVERGEALGIIGHNGAGKSTLLKILSRITGPTRGRADIYGRVGSLLEVGTGFHPELTGRENIYLNGAILGMSRREIERRFDEIVAFSELERFVETPVKFYSSGMYVRLAFSVAAHLEPEILIMDEVLAVGDMAFQQKCLDKMNDIRRQGRTIFFVSHDMDAIRRVGEMVRDYLLLGLEHQDFSLPRLVEKLLRTRDPARPARSPGDRLRSTDPSS